MRRDAVRAGTMMYAGSLRSGDVRMRLSWSDRELGFRLGLGDLESRPICHGYANACGCAHCLERENAPQQGERPRQPWESAA